MNKKIVIMGAGALGFCLGKILRAQNHTVTFWDKNSKVLETLKEDQRGLPEIIPSADIILLCVPSWAVREALLYISPYLAKTTPVIVLAKGIETPTLKTMDQLLVSMLPKNQPTGLLHGMMLAGEMREGQFGGGVCGTKSETAWKLLTEIFTDTNLRIFHSADVSGVAWCGILKNIYALALGITYGLELGDDARGWITALALTEMKKIVTIFGGKTETVYGPAGVGDLLATGFSQHSKNHQMGISLAKGQMEGSPSEGVMSLPSVIIMLGEKSQKFTLLLTLSEIVKGNKDAGLAFKEILYK